MQNFNHISFKLSIEDNGGIYDINIPMINDNDIIIQQQIINKINTKSEIMGKIMHKSSVNELTLKYKVGGESDESNILFDTNSNTFCHIISDIITDSIIDEKCIDEGQNDDMISIQNDNILIPRRVIFVIDRSYSMIGSKWTKTISSTITAIKQLRNGYDRFGIILFDNNIELLPFELKMMKGCLLADNKSIYDSIQSLQNKNVGASTNINDALLKAIELIKIDILSLNNDSKYDDEYNFFMNQIIFITDGEPNNGESDTNKIISNIKNANDLSKIDKYNKKISIFSFGVGKDGNDSEWINDLNHSFLKLLSVNNNGFYQRIKETSADLVLSQYFNIVSKPILSNINIEYKNKNIKDLTNTHFNTLYYGNDLIICGKIENIDFNDDKNKNIDYNVLLTISSITGKQIKQNNKLITKPIRISKQMKININPNNKNNNNTERIWAYLKLQQFATQKLIYHDMIEIDDDEKDEYSLLPLSLGLKYKFVTPWTSMIVVKQKNNINNKLIQNKKQQQSAIAQQQYVTQTVFNAISQINVQLQATQCQLHSIVPQLTSLQTQLQKATQNQNGQQLEIQYVNLSSAYQHHYAQYILYMQQIQQLQTYLQQQQQSAQVAQQLALQQKQQQQQQQQQQQIPNPTVNALILYNDAQSGQNQQNEQQQVQAAQLASQQQQQQQLQLQQIQAAQLAAQQSQQQNDIMAHQQLQQQQQQQQQQYNNYSCSAPSSPRGTRNDDRMPAFPPQPSLQPSISIESITGFDNRLRALVDAPEFIPTPHHHINNNDNDNNNIISTISESGDDQTLSPKGNIDTDDSLKRIMKELKDLECNPPSNCSVGPISDDMRKWKVTINGPIDSVYKGGIFVLYIEIPRDYPLKPPKCKFITKIYHCNINQDGEINLEILNEDKWSPSLTIIKLLMIIINLLNHPNIDDPFMIHIAKLYKENRKQYEKIAKQWTEKYAK